MGAAFVADRDQALHLVWCATHGRRVRAMESTHPAAHRPVPRTLYERWLRDRGYAEVQHVVVLEDPGWDADEKRWLRSLGVTTSVSLPVLLGDEIVGKFSLGIDSGPPPREELEVLQGLANRFAFAVHLGRLAGEARAAVAQTARAAAVTEERQRLAREIHDTIAQGLAAIVRQLESARATSSPDAAARHVAVAADIARESLVEARRSIRALRPRSLEGHTLDAALRDLVDRSARVSSSAIRLQSTGQHTHLPGDVEDELFRIVNEAVTNAIKHASARTIVVDLSFEDASVRIGVRDDGVGFDPAFVRQGVGASSMRERAARIGAVVTVASEPGVGTEVLVYWAPAPND
jgi:signal transduction histidine kinase